MKFLILLVLIAFVVWMVRGYIQIVKMPKNDNQYLPDIMKCESPIERRLYNGLVQHGLYPTPQYQVGRYRIDLAFPYQKIAIECDGKAYHSTPEQKSRDKRKDKYLKENGWIVLRFSGSSINRDLSRVIRKIKEKI